MEFTNERWQHVTRRKIEVVFGTIQVGGHRRNEIAAVLTTVRLTQFDAGNLGDCVPLVRWFERTREQLLFGNWLSCMTRIDARTAEVQQLRDTHTMACFNHSSMDHEVVVNELGWTRAVSQNATDSARNQKHIIRTIVFKPSIHCTLVAEIELCTSGCEDVGETTSL